MSVALVNSTCYRPFFQALVTPAKLVYAVFLKAIGCLLSCLGVKEWGKNLQIKAEQIDSRSNSLLSGLWAYGRRFLVHSDNYEQSCRGSCYWLIAEHLRHPEIPLSEHAKAFEEGAPADAIALHKGNLIPADLIEEQLWSQKITGTWPHPPRRSPGIYTYLIGFSKDENTPSKAHRIAFFNNLLFDPNTGLSEWVDSDWEPLLNRIAESIRTDPAGFFTVECYSYRLLNGHPRAEHSP